jgi:hypothetical protein
MVVKRIVMENPDFQQLVFIPNFRNAEKLPTVRSVAGIQSR